MPLAFSTLGCPSAAIDHVVALAAAHGIRGVELRAADGTPVSTATPAAGRRTVRDAAAAGGVELICVDSYLRVCDPGDDRAFLADARAHVRLAADLGAPAVRVFPGRNGAGPDGDRRAVRRLAELAPHARDHGVRLLLETHDSHPRGRDLAPILEAMDAADPAHDIGVIWDVLHPWRAGEAPRDTLAAIGDRLAYVQIKDAEAGESGPLTLVGEGQAPLRRIAELLSGRSLWWSLEWEKAWVPELPELEVALDAARRWFDARVAGGERSA